MIEVGEDGLPGEVVAVVVAAEVVVWVEAAD